MILTFGKYVHLLQEMVKLPKLVYLTPANAGFAYCLQLLHELSHGSSVHLCHSLKWFLRRRPRLKCLKDGALMDTTVLSPVPIFLFRITGFVYIGAPRPYGVTTRPSYPMLRG